MDSTDPVTRFLDLRGPSSGGVVAADDGVQLRQWTGGNNYQDEDFDKYYAPLSSNALQSFIQGKDVLIATHGYNVNRNAGIQTLSMWRQLLCLPDKVVFIGVLWPGDSESFHALSYPVEPAHAMAAGTMLGKFVEDSFRSAASISFVSHSLGACVILEAIKTMTRNVRRAILMAGAVDDRCLTREFACVQNKVDVISVLASQEDEVLRWAFPAGDLLAEIFDHDHPWWESALGRFGPASSPSHYQPPCQIPKDWNYGHGDYLRTDPPAPACISPPTYLDKSNDPDVPVPIPLNHQAGWQEAWSASFV